MDDLRPRATMTLWPIFTYLMIFAALLGFVTWLVLFLIFNLNQLPYGWQLVSLPAGAAAGAWARRYYRSLSLPVLFPPSPDELDYLPRQPRTWLGRYAGRQREIIRAEFAARGYPLPD